MTLRVAAASLSVAAASLPYGRLREAVGVLYALLSRYACDDCYEYALLD